MIVISFPEREYFLNTKTLHPQFVHDNIINRVQSKSLFFGSFI